jgi:polyhydroxybutyrate depolymerase
VQSTVALPTTLPSTTTLPPASGSAGCGKRPLVRGLTRTAPGDVPLTFKSGGVERSYRLGVPKSYNEDKPALLILDLPGANETALEQSFYTDIPRQATARGMITVTPDAIAGFWQLSPKGTDDDFLVALVRYIESRYCVDLEHVGVTGVSLGAWKATEMACGHPDIFASVGLVGEEVHPTSCPPMPVIAFHGTADPTVPYGAGADPGVTVTGPNAGLTGARYNIASWAAGGRCSTYKQVRRIGGDVVLWTYPGCTSGVDVELYTILHGGHTWPGAAITIGPTTHTIDATKLILDFFESHSLRHRGP